MAGKCASQISAVLFIAIGMTGQSDLDAILKLPSWNGSISVSLGLEFRVPSGKIQMEIPDFIFSVASSMVFNPCLISVRSRKRQWR